MSESDAGLDGYSLPLCSKIVHTLWSRDEKFHIRTTCVLGHNTKRDSDGNTYPIFNGFVVSFCKNCYSLFFCAIITRVFIPIKRDSNLLHPMHHFRWRLQQEESSRHVLIEVPEARMKLSEEYEFLLLMKILVGKGSC